MAQQIAAQAQAHGLSKQQTIDRAILALHVIKRLLEPDEVAELVAFLCSEHVRGITGTSIAMDLGWTAH